MSTPQWLPKAKFFTGAFNVAYGFGKVANGTALLVSGAAEDVTGIGAVLGIPTDAYGGYQFWTGAVRIRTGGSQLVSAASQPTVRMTPVQYFENASLSIAPLGSVIQELTGWGL